MLSLTAGWSAAMSPARVRPVVLCEITSGSTTIKARYGRSTDSTIETTYTPAIEQLTPVSVSLDPTTRGLSVSTVTLRFAADGWAKRQHVAYRLKGRSIVIKAGTRDMALASYQTVLRGIVDEARCTPTGGLEIVAADLLACLRDLEVSGLWLGMNPVEVLADIMPKAGLVSGTDWNAASFAASDATNATLGHIVLHFGEPEPVEALDLLSRVLTTTGGIIRGFETGVLEHVPWNAAASAVAAFTDSDIVEGSFEVVEQDEGVVNDVAITQQAVKPAKTMVFTDMEPVVVRRQDTASQTVWSRDGSAVLRAHEAEHSIARGQAYTGSAWSSTVPAVGTTVTFKGLVSGGVCGTRWPNYPDGSQPSWAQVSTTKPLYLLIDDEIVEFDTVTPSRIRTQVVDRNADAPASLRHTETYYVTTVEFTARVKARGATPTAHKVQSRAHDVTLSQMMASRILARQNYGRSTVRFRTSLASFAYQIGDFATLTTPRFFGYGDESLGADVKWEIIGKDAVFSGDEIGITWTLATVGSVTAPTVAIGGYSRLHDGLDSGRAAAAPTVSNYKVVGGVASVGAGLTVSVTAATVTFGSVATELPAQTLTLDASRDNYVFFDGLASGYTIVPVALGAAAPTADEWHVLLSKVVTGASSVSTVTNYTATRAFRDAIVQTDDLVDLVVSGAKLAVGAVTETKLADLAVASAKIADSAIGESKIAALAVTTAKLGALAVSAEKLAASAVTAEKIDTAAVTETKIATGAVATAKIAAEAVTPTTVSRTYTARVLVKNRFLTQ